MTTYSLQPPPPPSVPPGPLGHDIRRLAPWFHNLHLPTGEQTAPDHPLGDFPSFKWRQIAPHIDEDLTGRTALDIGCNAGFYSLQLARRGARVTGIDHDEHYLSQARWAAERFGLAGRVEYRRLGVYDLGKPGAGLDEAYDLVVFMGVLYHLRHPLLGLELAASKVGAGGAMVFQTLTLPEDAVADTPVDLPIDDRARMTEPGWPRMAFVEKSVATDRTNWWLANAACCEAMLRSVGLRVVCRPGHEIYVCRSAEARRPALSDETAGVFAPPTSPP